MDPSADDALIHLRNSSKVMDFLGRPLILRPKVFRLIALLISLFFVFVFVEISLRTFLPVRFCDAMETFRHDPDLGISFAPGVHVLQTTDYQQEVKINRLGTVNFQEDFTGFKSLVFAVGDSFTQGVGLPTDASYPAQLDLVLNIRDGRYETLFGVVNLGMGGYGGMQNILQLKKYAQKLDRPDFILYLGCQNDAQDDEMFRRGERHRAIFSNTPGMNVFWTFRLWITRQTEIGKRARLAWGRLRGAGPMAPAPGSTGSAFSSQMENLQEIARCAHEWNAMLVVSWASDDADYQAMKRWANTQGIDFADWAPTVRSLLQANSNLPPNNPHSGGHYRTWVNAIIARTFAEIILNHAPSPAPRSPFVK